MNRVTYAELVIGRKAAHSPVLALLDIERGWHDEEGYVHLVLGGGTAEGDVAEHTQALNTAFGLELGRDLDGKGTACVATRGTLDCVELEAASLEGAAELYRKFKKAATPLAEEEAKQILKELGV